VSGFAAFWVVLCFGIFCLWTVWHLLAASTDRIQIVIHEFRYFVAQICGRYFGGFKIKVEGLSCLFLFRLGVIQVQQAI